MAERRELKRRHLIYYLRVFDRNTDKIIGHLVDITTEGLMLISEGPLETDAIFELRMDLPSEIEGVRKMDCLAHSRWCRKDDNPDFFNTGFSYSFCCFF